MGIEHFTGLCSGVEDQARIVRMFVSDYSKPLPGAKLNFGGLDYDLHFTPGALRQLESLTNCGVFHLAARMRMGDTHAGDVNSILLVALVASGYHDTVGEFFRQNVDDKPIAEHHPAAFALLMLALYGDKPAENTNG